MFIRVTSVWLVTLIYIMTRFFYNRSELFIHFQFILLSYKPDFD
jgi:hypothetical protein